MPDRDIMLAKIAAIERCLKRIREAVIGDGFTFRRRSAYRRWFNESIPQAEWDLIREAVQRNWAYGNNGFEAGMEKALQRKFALKKAGRKPEM